MQRSTSRRIGLVLLAGAVVAGLARCAPACTSNSTAAYCTTGAGAQPTAQPVSVPQNVRLVGQADGWKMWKVTDGDTVCYQTERVDGSGNTIEVVQPVCK